MRRFVVTLMASLLSCSAAFAFWPEAADSSLEVGVGYRQDRLEWKTNVRSDYYDSYDNSSSNYYSDYVQNLDIGRLNSKRSRSHLKWRDLEIVQIELRGKYVTCDNIYLRAFGDYGWITHGKNTDRDSQRFDSYDNYSGSFETDRSHARARGHVYDAEIAAGYQFKFCDDSFSIAPLVGYSWHGQHIEDRNLRHDHGYDFYDSSDDFSSDSDFTRRAKGRDSSSSSNEYCSYYTSGSSSRSNESSDNGRHAKYHTRWDGPFVGFDFDYRFGCACEWTIFGDYEFHWAEFHAKAHWPLRHDIHDKFHHHAKNAYGNRFDIGVRWDFMECWTVAVKGEFQWWYADHGRDRAVTARARNGNLHVEEVQTIPLKHVRWQSAAVMVDLGMVF